jgi:hypothetical protein
LNLVPFLHFLTSLFLKMYLKRMPPRSASVASRTTLRKAKKTPARAAAVAPKLARTAATESKAA